MGINSRITPESTFKIDPLEAIATRAGVGKTSIYRRYSSKAKLVADAIEAKYLQPRREAFAVVLERAKERQEVKPDLEPGLVFDTMSGTMLYVMIFPPTAESWEAYIRRSLELILE
ncbi:MAG TPA: TetR/AcrR family transcriptional regulator C-terminal ligand-binding domain-containing protein [Leptolyngbyaceae cyanobacterium M33_DOE_097]|uniref:TetR/AcrR family transcriptional regulator n=1 Tax=Oscillatoriales cyanobacterium SpSt-418 TaxID=2282169 RepID=A0A7C3KHG9_9CYAN|nr:TetR/AcrR family transcriptional regulator C-terminal ligand-binding domain-containing protein [Leptolyngbyaceae cyanobacterium M33_DOE_097]